jgi:hypothetical protein
MRRSKLVLCCPGGKSQSTRFTNAYTNLQKVLAPFVNLLPIRTVPGRVRILSSFSTIVQLYQALCLAILSLRWGIENGTYKYAATGEEPMSKEVRFTSKSANQGRYLYALLLLTILSVGLAGCAGFVSGNGVSSNTQPPALAISAVQAGAATTTGFQVSWVTNIAANSEVDYGTSASYGSSTPVNAAMVTNHQVSLASLTAGTLYHFRVRSTDASNATAVSGDMTFSTTANTAPPTVSITSPANGATVSATVSVTASASSSIGVASVQFQLDGTNLGNAVTSAPYSVSWNTTKTANGSHALRAIATDTAGTSTTSAAVTVTVSNQGTTPPPTVSITAPANGSSVSGTITVTATASSSIGVASVQFVVDGAAFGSPDTTTPYSISLDTTALSNGNHTLAATAKDTAGNTATSAAITVTVSNTTTPPGGTVTSFTLTSPNAGTFPFTVGLGFKKGDVPSGASLSLANQQVIAKTNWSDGSIKTAVASGLATLAANAPYTVNVTNTPTSGGTAMTCSNIQNAAPSASVQVGSLGTVSLSSLLASPFRSWISGPQMVECHYRSSVASDPSLDVWFYVRLYSNGTMWVRTIVYNGTLDQTNAVKSYTYTIIIGSTTVFNKAVSLGVNAAFSEFGWIGQSVNVTPAHNTTYLEASKLVPNYMNLVPSQTVLNAQYQTYPPTPMANGDLSATMGDEGFQYDIGLFPRWSALFITSGASTSSGYADPRAYNAMLANDSALNSYPIIWHDSTTHLTPDPVARPTWTVNGAGGGGATDVFGSNGLEWDVAHHPSIGYLSYIVTGDYFFYQTLEDQAAMCYLVTTSAYGSGVNRPITGVVQSRGQAWCFRTLAQLAAIAPSSDTVAADYTTYLSNSIYSLNTEAQSATALGYLLTYEIGTNAYSSTASVLAPWQEHFLDQSLGMGSDIEALGSNMTNWNALKTHAFLAPVGILGQCGVTTNFCFTQGSSYNLIVDKTPGAANPSQWFPDWGTLWTANFGSPNTAADNTLHGSSGSDPANACIGMWGNLMPAIAYAVDQGATGASAAWARLTGATNWSSVLNCTASVPSDVGGFNDTPIWGIIPRSATSTQPPPTTSVSVTAPAANATVSGTVTVTASATSSVGIASVRFLLDNANLGTPVTTAPYSVSWSTTTATNGIHFLAATATDTQGNLTASSSVSVTVSNTAAAPPVISAVTSIPSSTGAVITWTTDQSSTSQAEYGTTTSYGNQSTLNSSLVTAHSVTLTGLAASTTYDFAVESTNAGGDTTVSANFSFTTTASSGGGIPSALGWYQIPNTTLSPNCPNDASIQGATGCQAVINAWGGAAADTVRNRMYIWGGGHTDYYGNEVYALDLNALTMTRIINPVSNPSLCAEAQSNGTPSSRHTYDNLAYVPPIGSSGDNMFSWSGAPACGTGIGSNGTWNLHIPTLTWTNETGSVSGGHPDGTGGLGEVAYDPNTNLVFIGDTYSIWTYNTQTNTYTQVNNNAPTDYHMSSVVDPVHKLFILMGGGGSPGGGMQVVNIASGSDYALQDWTSSVSGCSALTSAGYPGLAFDSAQNKVVGWVGGDSVIVFDPSAKTCTTVTYSGGPGSAQGNGTNGRFAYFPLLNLFAVVNDWQENAYTLRLTQ